MSPNPRRRLFDIATIAAWTGVLSALGSWTSISGYGGSIHIENHLCHNLAYNGHYVLTHGSWKSHCNMILGGSDDGCQLNGVWNRGAEGMMQFEVEGTGRAINLYFRMSGGWGNENRVHAFWSDVVSNSDALYATGCWYDHCEAHTDAQLDCYKWYHGECTHSHQDYPQLDRVGSVEVRYNVGSGNNPDMKVEFYSDITNDPDGQCNAFGAKAVAENVDVDDELTDLSDEEQDRIAGFLQLKQETQLLPLPDAAHADEEAVSNVDDGEDDLSLLTEEEQARIKEFAQKLQEEKNNGEGAETQINIGNNPEMSDETKTQIHDS